MDKLTPAEQVVLTTLASAVNAFFQLPAQHPADRPEFVTAIHAAQNIVTSRLAARIHPELLTGADAC